MAYWLADGSCTKDRGSYNIKIAQCENDWMYEELKEIPFKIYKCKESLIIHNKELGNELSEFGKCTEKYIPENIKELNPELIRIFLMAYAKTDGHIRKGKNWKGYQFNDSIVFFTTSDKMASDLGELILKAGGRPSYYLNKIQGKEIEFRNGTYRINKDCWVISWNTQIHTWISNLNISEVDYNDNVYCVEVLKYNTVLVRRNGKVCWSGNCRSTTVPVIDYENFGKKKEKLTFEEERAIMKYKSPSMYVLNDKLRKDIELDKEEKEWVKNLDSALKKMPYYKGEVVRTLNIDAKELKNFIWDCVPNKKIFNFKAYTSTSKGEIYDDSMPIRFIIQNSTKGRDISKFGLNEDEILYERNCKFKVLNVEYTQDNKFYIYLEESNE